MSNLVVSEKKLLAKKGYTNKEIDTYSNEVTYISNYIESQKDKNKFIDIISKNKEFVHQKIIELANLGLSISKRDYYIIPYANNLNFNIDYKGIIRIASKSAIQNGYQLFIKSDTIRKNFKKIELKTIGLIDNLELENGSANDDILSAYSICTLIDIKTRNITMQKVEVIPAKEYQKIKSLSRSHKIYEDFESEMAKKIAIRRCLKIIETYFPNDTLSKIFEIDNEDYTINNKNEIKEKKQDLNDILQDDNKKDDNKKDDNKKDNIIEDDIIDNNL
jgi:recombination protein RecT